MPITQLTPNQEIDKMIALQIQRREQALIYQLSYIGETVVNLAKETRGYTDRTGNLVSSTGYVVVKDGKIVGSPSFESKMNGDKGKQQGQEFAARKATELIPSGIGLVVVAGMNYAEYVEATGRNVLKLSEIEAKKMAEQMFKKISKK
jgi:pyrimidine deaminase RibD-like protein